MANSMEDFFVTLVKLTTIFIGSGITCLIAYWVVNEAKVLAKLIMCPNAPQNKDIELIIVKSQNLNSNIGFYEAKLSDGKTIKIFSSDSGMKIV